jgi:hypothetical protein
VRLDNWTRRLAQIDNIVRDCVNPEDRPVPLIRADVPSDETKASKFQAGTYNSKERGVRVLIT